MTLAPFIGTPYPKTGVSRVVSPSQIGVRVPRRVREMRPLEVAVYALLWARNVDGRVRVSQSSLASQLGRHGRPDAIARALSSLESSGVIARRRSTRSHASTIRVLVRPEAGERYDVIPHTLLEALAAGQVSVSAVRSWLHLDQALGRQGWTSDTAAELAAAAGCSSATIRAHLQALAGLDEAPVVITRVGEKSRWMLSRPHDQLPGDDGAPSYVEGPDASRAASARANEDVEEWTAAGVAATSDPRWGRSKSAWSDAQKVRGPVVLSPEDLTPENPPSTPCVDRSVSDRPGSATDGRKRPKMGSSSAGDERKRTGRRWWNSQVEQVLAVIDRRWLGRWVNGAAAAIDQALESGLAPQAACTAWLLHGPAAIDQAGGRQVPAVRAALQIVAVDIRHGLACRECGEPLEAPGGACQACQPATESSLGLDAGEELEDGDHIRGRAMLSLGFDLDQIRELDPDAYQALTRHGATAALPCAGSGHAVAASRAGGVLLRPGLGRSLEGHRPRGRQGPRPASASPSGPCHRFPLAWSALRVRRVRRRPPPEVGDLRPSMSAHVMTRDH